MSLEVPRTSENQADNELVLSRKRKRKHRINNIVSSSSFERGKLLWRKAKQSSVAPRGQERYKVAAGGPAFK